MAATREHAPPITLRFPLVQVLDLMAHALEAESHFPTDTEEADDVEPVPALHWIADDGTYLMSNGDPSLLGPTGKPYALFAEGWGSGSDRAALGETAVGHDDVLETIPLSRGLHERAAAAYLLGWRWFEIVVTGDGFSLAFAKGE